MLLIFSIFFYLSIRNFQFNSRKIVFYLEINPKSHRYFYVQNCTYVINGICIRVYRIRWSKNYIPVKEN